MWQVRWIEAATRVGRSFNNDQVFQTIETTSSEYTDPIVYRPLPEYMRRRFIPHIETLGPQQVATQLAAPLPGQRHAFSRETRVLALLTGLRETGLPMMVGHRPSNPATYEVRGRQLFIRNFGGSGLDYVNRSRVRRGILEHLDPAAARPGRGHRYSPAVIRDDPASADSDDVLMNQSWMRTIFNAYLRYQLDQYLAGMDLDAMRRPVRLFWRSLTFGAQGGNDWRDSQRGSVGLQTVKNLMDLLGLDYGDVPELWRDARIRELVAGIDDSRRGDLASLARMETDHGRIDRIRDRIPGQVRSGLRNARYFQAIKMAAITDGYLTCLENGTFDAPTP